MILIQHAHIAPTPKSNRKVQLEIKFGGILQVLAEVGIISTRVQSKKELATLLLDSCIAILTPTFMEDMITYYYHHISHENP
jgi:hypothetical protein